MNMSFSIKVNGINITNIRELSALAEKDCEAQNILGEMFFGGEILLPLYVPDMILIIYSKN